MSENQDIIEDLVITEMRPIRKSSTTIDYLIGTCFGQQILQLPNNLVLTNKTIRELGEQIKKQHINNQFSNQSQYVQNNVEGDVVLNQSTTIVNNKVGLDSGIQSTVPPPVMIRAAAMSSEISMNESNGGEGGPRKQAQSSDSIESITTTTTTKTTYRQIAPKPPPPPAATTTAVGVVGAGPEVVVNQAAEVQNQFSSAASDHQSQTSTSSTTNGGANHINNKQQMPIILMSVDPRDSNYITETNSLLKVVRSENVINNGVPTKIVYVDYQKTNPPGPPIEQDQNMQRDYDEELLSKMDLDGNQSYGQIYQESIEELKDFAKVLKQKRIELGYTQGDLGTMIGRLYNNDFSQTTISRFESMNLSHKNMCKLLPILQNWIFQINNKDNSQKISMVKKDPQTDFKRRKRTSIETRLRTLLEHFFLENSKPNTIEINDISSKIGIDKEVIRIWFCNRRQKEKRVNPLLSSSSSMDNGAEYSLDCLGSIACDPSAMVDNRPSAWTSTSISANTTSAVPAAAAFAVMPSDRGVVGGGIPKSYANATLIEATSTPAVTADAAVVNKLPVVLGQDNVGVNAASSTAQPRLTSSAAQPRLIASSDSLLNLAPNPTPTLIVNAAPIVIANANASPLASPSKPRLTATSIQLNAASKPSTVQPASVISSPNIEASRLQHSATASTARDAVTTSDTSTANKQNRKFTQKHVQYILPKSENTVNVPIAQQIKSDVDTDGVFIKQPVTNQIVLNSG